ncbi:MAG: SMP-30/gluconolactonase/LRE family protein [Myxococcota bacterium]
MRTALAVIAGIVLLTLAYFLLWPVPVDPVAWDPPPNAGYTGAHATNQRLATLERVAVPELTGPEDLVQSPEGTLYTTSHEGVIARMEPGSDGFTPWVTLEGRPLGIDWDASADRLVVADAYEGLYAVGRDGTVTELATEADGIPIRYADDVVAASDGRLYFSDASTKFGAHEHGGTYEASLLDIMEHGGHGRILVYDPTTQVTTTLVDGLEFANGVALNPAETVLYVAETGMYRILAIPLSGSRKGAKDVFIDNLPGFPDNLSRGQDGRIWVGLVSSRRAIVDQIAPSPFVRRIIQRLPRFTRPEATRYGHVVAIDALGRVVADLQDPSGSFARTTGALEVGETLWISSLHEPDLGRLNGWQSTLR